MYLCRSFPGDKVCGFETISTQHTTNHDNACQSKNKNNNDNDDDDNNNNSENIENQLNHATSRKKEENLVSSGFLSLSNLSLALFLSVLFVPLFVR